MKNSRRLLSLAVAVALGATPTMQATAEDIDLFVSAAAVAATNPNVLIILDNSANWNSNAQHWPTPAGETGPYKQGESELRAIKSILKDLDPKDPKVNLGLMMFRRGGNDSAFLRYAVRPMEEVNLNGFIELIGERSGCSGTNSVNGTANCILQNFSGTGVEQQSTAAIDYSAAMFETYKYFGGYTSPAYAQKDQQPPGAVNDRLHHKLDLYWQNDGSKYIDATAYTDTSFKTYKSPIASPCAKNYIIFIGNGFPSQDTAGPLIANVNGGASPLLPAQQSVQNFTTTVGNVTDNLGTYAACSTNATCATAAAAAAPGLYDTYSCSGGSQNTPQTGIDGVCHTNAQCVSAAQTAFPGFTNYSCSGGTSTTVVSLGAEPSNACLTVNECQTAAAALFPTYTAHTCGASTNTTGCVGQRARGRPISATQTCAAGTLINQTMSAITGTACTGSNFLNQTMEGNKQVTTIVPLSTFSTPTKVNYADEWAKFLYTTDVSELPGQQNVTTYTIDVFKDQQDADETALLSNMAKFGGGKYFQARNEQAIVDALRQILIEVQSVNSVFASASLPINATNRSQNENQVFIGMFRPDGSGNPRWFGNLKRYQIAQFGQEFKLGDASTPPLDAVSTATGFIQPCAKSFWTEDSGNYWDFLNGSAGQCTSASTSIFSDSPDGPQVEKGAVAEVLRRGNNPPTTPGPLSAKPDRTIYTCMNSKDCCTAPAACGITPATELVAFNATNVSKEQLGDAAMIDALRDNIINFTLGYDVNNENAGSGDTSVVDVRASVHGDVAHSRPLPVNYGDPTGVVLYYGANDGHFRAIQGNDGKELWTFVAPEHHDKLARLTLNAPPIRYPNQDPVPSGATNKDYFFDGSAGLFQNADNSKIWIFPSMRRGGRMLYAFDVTTPTKPSLMWRAGCPLQDKDDGCTAGFEGIGQTWSIPAVALIKGYSATDPVIVVGGGYDPCEDEDAVKPSACGTPPKGATAFAIDAQKGTLLKAFGGILRSVPGDVTFVDRNFDGYADHGYVGDTGGGLYRIDFVKPGTLEPLAPADWTVTHIAQARQTDFHRKFLFTPAALPGAGKVFLTVGSGDRERPLITNYPYQKSVLNRFYMFIDTFATTGLPVDIDDATKMDDFTKDTDCGTTLSAGSNGWFMDLNAHGQGEQTVTSSTIFGGLAFFSTNRPLPTAPGACVNELGEARGYAVNLINASGAADTFGVCGGARSAAFAGGGLPPSPVTGTVPVGPNGTPVTVMIGGVNRGGGVSTPIGAQRVTPTITQRRSRIYWYMDGDK